MNDQSQELRAQSRYLLVTTRMLLIIVGS